jgi:hypothetical protein
MAEPQRAERSDHREFPYLRVTSGSDPAPRSLLPFPHKSTSGRVPLRVVDPDAAGASRDQEVSKTGPAGVSWGLWAVLAASILLLAGVRIYARHAEATSSVAAPLPAILTHSPDGPAASGSLRLSWDPVESAYVYRLQIKTVSGGIVLDRLPLHETAWTPPDELLPALSRGEYLWQVEAQDPQEKAIARSYPATFRIVS